MGKVSFTTLHTTIYILGCILIALAVNLVIRSQLGTSSWDTLHVAISITTPLTIGMATIVVAGVATAIVMLMNRALKYLLMAIPIIFVGILIDVFNDIVLATFHPEFILIRMLLFIIALLIFPLGGALLLLSTYPAGVLEELMLSLMRFFKTKKLIYVRIALDSFALGLALFLTLTFDRSIGSLQWGTLIFILAIGPLLQQYLIIIRRLIMKLNKYIDHTYLKAFGTKEDIDQLLDEAITYDFKSVCVNPTWVTYAAESLKKSDVLVCTVIGFPLGASTTRTKVFETEDAIENGADEIDMVINVGWVKSGQYDLIKEEVKQLKEACGKRVLKVILETCYLTNEEIRLASIASFEGNADFVKTSTGFGTGGATLEAVKIMAEIARGKGVKASGGVKTKEDVNMMIEAGATRIGTSSGVALMNDEESQESY